MAKEESNDIADLAAAFFSSATLPADWQEKTGDELLEATGGPSTETPYASVPAAHKCDQCAQVLVRSADHVYRKNGVSELCETCAPF